MVETVSTSSNSSRQHRIWDCGLQADSLCRRRHRAGRGNARQGGLEQGQV